MPSGFSFRQLVKYFGQFSLHKKKIIWHELALKGPEFHVHTNEKFGFVTSLALHFSVFIFYLLLSLHYLGEYSSFWRRDKLSGVEIDFNGEKDV